jgi:hypothetical protein
MESSKNVGSKGVTVGCTRGASTADGRVYTSTCVTRGPWHRAPPIALTMSLEHSRYLKCFLLSLHGIHDGAPRPPPPGPRPSKAAPLLPLALFYIRRLPNLGFRVCTVGSIIASRDSGPTTPDSGLPPALRLSNGSDIISYLQRMWLVLNLHLNMVVWPIPGPKPTPQYGRVANPWS